MYTSIIFGVLAALIVFVFMYIDSKLFDEPKTKLTYFKNMLLTGAIVGGGIYLLGESAFESALNFNKNANSSTYMSEYGEEIMTGNPQF